MRCVLLLQMVVFAACRTFPSSKTQPVVVAGPWNLTIVGDALFVTDDFNRTLRRIDLKTGDNRRTPLPDGFFITDIENDGQGGLLLADVNGIWRMSLPSGSLVPIAGGKAEGTAEAGRSARDVSLFFQGGMGHFQNGDVLFNARRLWRVGRDGVLMAVGPLTSASEGARRSCLAWPSRTWLNSITVGADDTPYAACWGEYAEDHRIVRIGPASDGVTTVVGPGTHLAPQKDQADAEWRIREPKALTLDHRGGLAFIDGGSNSIMRLDLESGVVQRVAKDFRQPADLTSDSDGNLYVADAAAQKVFKVDRLTGRIGTVAHVGGAKEALGFTDGVVMADEPPYITCQNDDGAGRFEIVVQADGGDALPGATVYQVEGERNIPAVADASGISRFRVEESRQHLFLVTMSGFKPQALSYRLSRGCVARVRVTLAWQHLY